MHISEINIYPIKSLKGIAQTEARIEKRGFEHDRRRMLTNESGMFFTQREFPKMATVSVEIEENGLKLSAADFEDLHIRFQAGTGKRANVEVWKNVVEAEIYEDSVNGWFSDVLDTKCQLVSMPDDTKRRVHEGFNHGHDVVGFADDFPFLFASESSLADLNSRLADPIPMSRFRPNIVVSGPEAFAEDTWKNLRIGNTTFRATKPSARCVVTTIDQTAGVSMGKEPLATLASFRQARDVFPETYSVLDVGENTVLFAQYFVAESEGEILRVGDRVEVAEMKG